MTGNGSNGNGHHLSGPQEAQLIHWRTLWILARRNWWLVTILPVVTVTLMAAWLAIAPKNYRATAVLRLADARRSLTRNVEQTSLEPERTTEQLLSQIQMMRSRSMAEAVVDSTGLRLLAPTRKFAPSLLTGVRVEPGAPADTLQLQFGAERYTVRNRSDSVTVAYGVAARIGGATFTVVAKPQATKARWFVLQNEQAIDRFTERLHTYRRPSTDIVDVSFIDR